MRPLSAHWPLLELDRWTISIIDSLTVSHLLALWVLLHSISSIPLSSADEGHGHFLSLYYDCSVICNNTIARSVHLRYHKAQS